MGSRVEIRTAELRPAGRRHYLSAHGVRSPAFLRHEKRLPHKQGVNSGGRDSAQGRTRPALRSPGSRERSESTNSCPMDPGRKNACCP